MGKVKSKPLPTPDTNPIDGDELIKATKPKKGSKSKLKMPKLGFFETLKKFFLNVALGAASLKLIEWFKNPENREKILSFTNFLKDNAKAIFTTLAALVALDIANGGDGDIEMNVKLVDEPIKSLILFSKVANAIIYYSYP